MSSSTFIVAFKSGTPPELIEEHIKATESSGGKVGHRYNSAIKGYSVEVPDNVVNALSLNAPYVEYIEADGEVTTQGKALLTE
ncbi:hypothetical protein BJ944DRAFT_203006 [Cunninghamella echinulata]|nr:hypothetical protein BJ944DRAFT_203006 [Cunninghamella echinulata]